MEKTRFRLLKKLIIVSCFIVTCAFVLLCAGCMSSQGVESWLDSLKKQESVEVSAKPMGIIYGRDVERGLTQAELKTVVSSTDKNAVKACIKENIVKMPERIIFDQHDSVVGVKNMLYFSVNTDVGVIDVNEVDYYFTWADSSCNDKISDYVSLTRMTSYIVLRQYRCLLGIRI